MDYINDIKKAISFIHENFKENITVADVSKHVYISPSHFATIFKTFTGYTVIDYLLFKGT